MRRRLLRLPVLTAALVAGLVAVSLLPRGDETPAGLGAEGREAYAYLASETALMLRARDTASPPHGPRGAAAVALEEYGEAMAGGLAAGGRWESYWPNAVAPLAVSIDSWREDLPPGDETEIAVTVINDTGSEETVDLRLLAVDAAGVIVESSRLHRLTVAPMSRSGADLRLRIPMSQPYLLAAELRARNPEIAPVWSRRKIGFADAGAAVPDPPFKSGCCSAGHAS